MVKAFSLFVIAILAACGGGGGSNTNGTDMPVWTGMVVHSGNIGSEAMSAQKSALNGVVIDGAIEGATVCLDLNINLFCDSGEPSATTATNGSYSLSLAGLNLAQIRGAHIISSVPVTAKDADDGGQTLAQAGKAAFNLMSPVEPFVSADGTSISSVVVSPMTTLVSHEMMTGVGKSAAASEATVVSAMGLANGTNLRANFAGQTDPTRVSLQKQARFVAAALGEVKKSIATSSASSTERERQIGALNYLRVNATALIAAANSSVAITANAQWRDARAALANNTKMPAPSSSALVADAQTFFATSTTMDTTVADWNSAIYSGFFNGYCASGSSFGTTYTCNSWNMTKVVADGIGRFISKRFVLENATWKPFDYSALPDSNYYPSLHSSGWSKRADVAGNYELDGNGGFAVSIPDIGTVGNVRLAIKDISGRTVSSLIGTDGDSVIPVVSDARYLPASFLNTVFPQGSKVYVVRETMGRDQYQIAYFSDSCGNPFDSITTFKRLIAKHLSDTNCSYSSVQPTLPLYGDGLNASFDVGGSDTRGTLTVWRRSSTPPFELARLADKGNYEVRTIDGVPLLFLYPPNSVVSARTTPQRESFFAVYNGTVRYGEYRSAAYQNFQRTDAISWNDVAMNAILAGAGLPAAPQ